jgi:hypothetical protein
MAENAENQANIFRLNPWFTPYNIKTNTIKTAWYRTLKLDWLIFNTIKKSVNKNISPVEMERKIKSECSKIGIFKKASHTSGVSFNNQ